MHDKLLNLSGVSRFLWALSIASLLVCLTFAGAAKPAKQGDRPNVLFIIIDDHPAYMVSVLNESVVKTPNLCGLDQPTRQVLDGIDLAPVLKGETKERGRPVLSTYTRGNHTVRSNRYRYIRYANGDEELYDHDADPHEWENLADHPDLEPVKKEMRRWLPQRDAPSIGNGTNWKGSVK